MSELVLEIKYKDLKLDLNLILRPQIDFGSSTVQLKVPTLRYYYVNLLKQYKNKVVI